MSLPNRGDPANLPKNKKSGGGVDASMITRMKREQAIVSELRTEPTVRTGVSFAISDVTADGTNPLIYTFPAQQSPPFVVGENVTVSGNSAFNIVSSTAAKYGSTQTVTSSSIATGGVVSYTAGVGTPTIAVGTVFKVTVAGVGLILNDYYYVTAVGSGTMTIVKFTPGNTSSGGAIEGTVPGASTTGTATFSVDIMTQTYGTTTASLFSVGDTVTITGSATTGANGTFVLLDATATSIRYQGLGVPGTYSAAASTTFRPATPGYNGIFKITACTNSTVTLTTTILASFSDGRASGTISGNLPFGSVYSQIRDGMKTRGFTDGPIMPFYARGGSLGFYRVI